MANKELAREVLLQTLAFPEHHDQSSWISHENPSAIKEGNPFNCNTTACLAGTAVLVGSPEKALDIIDWDKGWVDMEYPGDWPSEATKLLGEELRFDLKQIFHTVDGSYDPDTDSYLDAKGAKIKAITRFAELFDLDLEELKVEARKLRKRVKAAERRRKLKNLANLK